MTRTGLDLSDVDRDRETLRGICAVFPDRQGLIQRLYQDRRSFRELCHDFEECAAAVNRWHQRAAAEAEDRSEEYSELLAELGQEIEAWLEADGLSGTNMKRRRE